MLRRLSIFLFSFTVILGVTSVSRGGTATDLTGLYYTGVDNSNGLLAGGSQDSHWTLTYARVAGTQYTGNSAYTGSAYVVSSNYIDAGWVPNTSSAQWITAPGAKTAASGGTTNVGGDYLPGNGTSGTNQAAYVYRLSFTISGTGTGTVTNQVSMSLTIAADDQYTVYVNPASAPTVNNSGVISAGGTAASGSRTSAWNNTTALTLQNGTNGTNGNAIFNIGTNFIYVVVQNTNSITGSSSSSALNPSGLLVYQVGSAITIDGRPIPEVGAWLPVAGALGLYLVRRIKRRISAPASLPVQG
jgi:hypothetical protein